MKPLLDPKRTVAELKELRALTGDENGAQRAVADAAFTAARRLAPMARTLAGFHLRNISVTFERANKRRALG